MATYKIWIHQIFNYNYFRSLLPSVNKVVTVVFLLIRCCQYRSILDIDTSIYKILYQIHTITIHFVFQPSYNKIPLRRHEILTLNAQQSPARVWLETSIYAQKVKNKTEMQRITKEWPLTTWSANPVDLNFQLNQQKSLIVAGDRIIFYLQTMPSVPSFGKTS